MLRLVPLTVLALVAVVACSGGPPGHVRIGLVAPLSGDRAYLGQELVAGARMAVDEINAQGGLLGEDVELVVRDDSDLVDVPGQLAELAERARVSAVIGPETPGVLLGPRNPLTRREVPAVLATGFGGDLRDAGSTVVRTVPSAADQARTLAGWLVEERGVRRVAVLAADPVEGPVARRSVLSGLTAGGVEVTAVVEGEAGATDLTAAVAELRDAAGDADAVLLWTPPPAAARATRAVRDLGWDVQVMVPATSFVAEYRSLAGDASEGVVLAFPFREDWFTTGMEEWLVGWYLRHGIGALGQLDTLVLDLPVVGIAAYDAVGLVAEAVRVAGSRVPADVGDAIVDVAFDGLLQDYDLDPSGDREAWSPDDLYVARFHNFAVVYDVDPRLDRSFQERFYHYQVEASYLPERVLEGPAGVIIRQLIEEGQEEAPPYEPPDPPPGPVARP